MSPLGVVSEETLPESELHLALTQVVHDVEEKVRSLLFEHVTDLRAAAARLCEAERLGGPELRRICGLPELGETPEEMAAAT
jgi:hypothetical protein